MGARIGHLVAQAEAGRPATGLLALQALPAEAVRNHQPDRVALAQLLRLAGSAAEANTALRRARGLTADPRVRRFPDRHSR